MVPVAEVIPAAKRERHHAGEFLHGYRVRKWLGDGAFSVVYLVEDPKTHVQYALKHVISEGEKEDRYLDQLRMEWEAGRKLKAVREASAHAYPVADPEQMAGEIERGYLGDGT